MRLRNIKGSKELIQSSPYVVQNPSACFGRWQSVFRNNYPIHIEVGIGKGRFIMDLARLNPQINYIGIEMYDSVLLRAIQKKELTEELQNLYFICMDARKLPEVFEKGEVERIYLNFSDPWPKERHVKRRLTSREFLKRYDQILDRKGSIEFKTDNRELFEFSLAEVRSSDWHLEAYTFDLHHDPVMKEGNIMTEYEEKFSKQGNPIHKLMIKPS